MGGATVRRFWVFAAPILLLGGLALADGADRFVREDGNNDAGTPAIFPVQLKGVGTTLLIPHTCAANSCTRDAPTLATEGLMLDAVNSYWVEACLSTGTFAGAGTLDWYFYNSSDTVSSTRWKQVMELSKTPTSGTSCVRWPNQLHTANGLADRLVIRSNGVTTSAAAPTLTVSIYACAGPHGCGR